MGRWIILMGSYSACMGDIVQTVGENRRTNKVGGWVNSSEARVDYMLNLGYTNHEIKSLFYNGQNIIVGLLRTSLLQFPILEIFYLWGHSSSSGFWELFRRRTISRIQEHSIR